MKILAINGSPRKKGIVSTLIQTVIDSANEKHDVELIHVYDLNMKPCIACMKCRPDGVCALQEDDAHLIGRKINEADGIIIGTPTYWGNMSSLLKMLFDRNVPVFMGESKSGVPVGRQKGKRAIIITACTTPWPFNFILPQSRGAVRAVKEILCTGGYRISGVIVKPGTKANPEIPSGLLHKAKSLGKRF